MIVAVMMPREKWTDDRLDDLSKKVDGGFADTKTEMRQGFARLDKDIRELRRDMNALHSEMTARFEAANRNLIGVAVAVIAAIIGSNAF
jgi:uncharacterized membrane protein YgaE (UPF0421/DUF939 family)